MRYQDIRHAGELPDDLSHRAEVQVRGDDQPRAFAPGAAQTLRSKARCSEWRGPMTVHVDMTESVITMDSRWQIILEKNADPLRGHLAVESSQEVPREALDAADTRKQIRHPNMDFTGYVRNASRLLDRNSLPAGKEALPDIMQRPTPRVGERVLYFLPISLRCKLPGKSR